MARVRRDALAADRGRLRPGGAEPAVGRGAGRRIPAFLAELEAESGVATHYARVGSLAVALDRDQLEALRRRFELLRDERRLAVAWLPGSECRELEPLLSPRVTAGIHAADDAQVDPRRLVGALRVAIARRGGILLDARVDGLELAGGRVVGVRVGDESLSAGTVVLAAGAWMGSLGAQAAALRIRPVKGQILRLRRPCAARTSRRRGLPRPARRRRAGRGRDGRGAGSTRTVTAGGVARAARRAAFGRAAGVARAGLEEAVARAVARWERRQHAAAGRVGGPEA